MCCAGQTIVAGVGEQSSVEVGKGSPVDRVITGLDHLGADLRHKNVVQVVVEVRLNRQRLIEELLVVLALHLRQHEDTTATTILRWAEGFTKHVKHLTKWVVNISVLSALEILCTHDNDKMGSAVELPANVSRSDKDLDSTIVIKMLNNALVALAKSFVVVANTVRECLGKGLLVDAIKQRLHLLHLSMKETVFVIVSERCGQEISSCCTGLFAAGYKDHSGLVRRHLCNSQICGFGHCKHKGREVRVGK